MQIQENTKTFQVIKPVVQIDITKNNYYFHLQKDKKRDLSLKFSFIYSTIKY